MIMLNEKCSKTFYDDRYEHGYMEAWPQWKRDRVRDLIRALDLPTHGSVLDYGCGNGVFTQVLVDALPGWEVFGVDISDVALRNARRRVPQAQFLSVEEAGAMGSFDFLFSHHVLEHALDLDRTLHDTVDYLGPRGAVLHILPCGNSGSLEEVLCRCQRGGVDEAKGNRFFFEDDGHLRRLTSRELSERYESFGLTLKKEFYACQSAGAINWITASGSAFVRMMFDPAKAIDCEAARFIGLWRMRLLTIALLRECKDTIHTRIRLKWFSAKSLARMALSLPFYPLGWLADRYCELRTRREWDEKCLHRNGSEMYLFFRRNPAQ